jgi:hypothetical protein
MFPFKEEEHVALQTVISWFDSLLHLVEQITDFMCDRLIHSSVLMIPNALWSIQMSKVKVIF